MPAVLLNCDCSETLNFSKRSYRDKLVLASQNIADYFFAKLLLKDLFHGQTAETTRVSKLATLRGKFPA